MVEVLQLPATVVAVVAAVVEVGVVALLLLRLPVVHSTSTVEVAAANGLL